jgi:hypothetical protein
LETTLSVVTGREVIASSLGTLFKKLNQLNPASDELRQKIWVWNQSRGAVIHQMVKLSNDHHSGWQERLAFARRTSKEGVLLLK